MGTKDLSEKHLESYPDVFADVVNALIYQGKQIVNPEELQAAPTETLYPGKEETLRNQFHDVSKYVVRDGEIALQYTIENETRANRKMVLRKAGYQGAVYREQVDGKKNYPVISMVLYWGVTRWRQPRSMKQLWAKENIGEMTWQYIDDIRLHVFEMAHLPVEVRARFKSDMRIVVDYLAEGKDYEPTRQPIVHMEALLLMLKALTGDDRYEQMIKEGKSEEKGVVSMCELLDRYERKGLEKAKEYEQKTLEKAIRSLMETMQLTAEQAMAALKVPVSDYAKFKINLSK